MYGGNYYDFCVFMVFSTFLGMRVITIVCFW
jgi:hypothetical protein